MKKLLTLVAATAMLASPFVLADDTANQNSNDVLQTVQPQSSTTQPMTVAENETNSTAVNSNENNDAKPAMKKKHHRHHCKKHCHGKKPRHHHVAKSTTKTEETVTTNPAS